MAPGSPISVLAGMIFLDDAREAKIWAFHRFQPGWRSSAQGRRDPLRSSTLGASGGTLRTIVPRAR